MSISDDIGLLSLADNTLGEAMSVLSEAEFATQALHSGLVSVLQRVTEVMGNTEPAPRTLHEYRERAVNALQAFKAIQQSEAFAMFEMGVMRELGESYIDRLQS